MVETTPSGQGVSSEGALSGPSGHSEAESTYKVDVKVERKHEGARNIKIQKKIYMGHV